MPTIGPEEYATLLPLVRVMSSIGIPLSLFVVLTYAVFEKKRGFPSIFVLLFALNSLVLTVAVALTGWAPDISFQDGPCLFQGILIQAAGVSEVWWWFCISCNLYVCVEKGSLEQSKRFRPFYYTVGFCAPIVFTVIPAVFGKIGNAELYCWLVGTDWELGMFYSWMGVLFIIGLAFWSLVMYRIYKLTSSSRGFQVKYLRHLLFIFSFAVVFLVMLLNRATSNQNFSLLKAHSVVLSGQGIFIFAVFGTSYDNVVLWKEAFLTSPFGVCFRTTQPLRANYDDIESDVSS